VTELVQKQLNDEDDFWADHDDDGFGNRLTLYDEPDYQDGFMWDCRDTAGDAEGCVKNRHKPVGYSDKRAKA
jgi:hypothetical protein